ncbi:T9SS type A sorting domain-containing protein [Dyadobacter sp. CY343]|uniref:T9SS type A sorting domain-containing protein n=1 Tax=Dyadobacter sp. CY343 TaxID=2907299 RepID=UPI001F1EB881|nr:T9SS type A sorting domain-containing protein [Dyadobacter sp. CY343]MCE7063399.1 T9SS type A sorting domain-containing protein [Dyadobacter sp. CY343]
MKRTFTQSLFAVLLSVLTWNASIAARPNFANEPFSCNDGIAYQTVNSVADNTSSLYGFKISMGAKTLIATLPHILNGLIYNSVDNMLWAFSKGSLVRIDSEGGTVTYPVVGLPSGINVGAELPSGYMLLYNNQATHYYVVDVNPGRATYLQMVDPTAGFALQTGPVYGTPISTPLAIADVAFVAKDQLCYGISQSGQIATLDPFTGNVTVGAAVSGLSGTDSYGAVFSDISGKIYAFQNNTGAFYLVNPATNTASLISTGDPSGNNDGASCANTILVDQPFTCNDGTAYQTINSANISSLYGFNVSTGAKTLIASIPFALNGLIYNSVDNMLWAFGKGSIVRIDSEGQTVTYPVVGLPSAINVGAELPSGYMLLYNNQATHYYVVDVDPGRATYLQMVDPTAGFALQTGPVYGTPISTPLAIADLAFVSKDQLCYGVTASGQIATLDPFTGNVTVGAVVNGLSGTDSYGAVFSDISGRLYAFQNSTGSFYLIHPSTNIASLISTGDPSGNNDGASCANTRLADLPFTCEDGVTYQVAVSASETTSSLYAYNVATGLRTLIAPLPYSVNGLVYNSVDNMLWGSVGNSIVRIDREGETTLFPIANLPGGFNIGVELPDGYMMLSYSNNANYYVVDIDPSRTTYLQLVDPTAGFSLKTGPDYGTPVSAPLDISDIAFVSDTQLSYGITKEGKLASLNPLTGAVVVAETSVTGLPASTYGAVISDITGRLYAFDNVTGSYYRINIATNSATLISTTIPSGNNDGASCANAIMENLPFICNDGTTYQIAAAAGETASSLYAFNVSTGTRTLIAPTPYVLNGLIYNSADNMLWAFINGTNRIVRIDSEGGVIAHTIANLPSGSYNIGVELPNGYMMLTATNTANYYVIDLNATRPTYLQLVDPTAGFVLKTGPGYGTAVSSPLDISDIAFVSSAQLAYGVTSQAKLASLNPFTGSVVVAETSVSGLPNAGYGAVVTDATSLLYAFNNTTGGFYKINADDNTADLINTFTPSGRNDGANCSTATLCDLPYAPVVSRNTVELLCPVITADLTALVTSITPSGSTLTFHTSATPSDGSLVSNPTNVMQGTYYAVYSTAGCALSTKITVTGCSLPVTLVSFTLTKEESIAHLTWSTTEETNSESFQIERSVDGQSWKQIGAVSAHGESSVLKKYEFLDSAPLKGGNYYRLKMVDRDGTFAYSRIQFGEFAKAKEPIYPNPASQNLFFTNYTEIRSVAIYNPIGVKVLNTQTISSAGLNVSNLSQGIYIAVLTLIDGSTQAQKVVIVK